MNLYFYDIFRVKAGLICLALVLGWYLAFWLEGTGVKTFFFVTTAVFFGMCQGLVLSNLLRIVTDKDLRTQLKTFVADLASAPGQAKLAIAIWTGSIALNWILILGLPPSLRVQIVRLLVFITLLYGILPLLIKGSSKRRDTNPT